MRKMIYLTLMTFLLSFALVGVAQAELIGWWRMDEGAGTTVADMSGRNHTGHFAEGTPEWVNGRSGKALQFDGSSKVEIPDHDDFHLTDAVSVALWMKPEADQPNYAKPFIKQKSGEYPYSLQYSTEQTIFATVNASARFDTSPRVDNFPGEWGHMCFTFDTAALILYKDGEEAARIETSGELQQNDLSLSIGGRLDSGQNFIGIIDDVKLFNHVLTIEEIRTTMEGEGFPYAFGPDPVDGAFVEDTWVTLSWSPGDFAVSHDVYLGENFDDVSNATIESELFRSNQANTFYIAGFPGYAYPEGLVPGTTYYWRIDEVNDADPNSPWKGDVWSFTIPPRTAYNPNPANGAESVDLEPTLSWTAGFGAKLHTVYFGESFEEVDSATIGAPIGKTGYSPGLLKMAKTYFWRVDEFDGVETYKGDIWNFTTLGAASNPNPADGAADVSPSQILSWTAGGVAASHDVYFGTEADAVTNATKASPEYKASKALGDESYDPGMLELSSTYYWRIDEVNDPNPDSPWIGKVWSFTTGNFLVVDDFEGYTDNDADGEAIWQHWIDGFDVPDNGAQVGYFLPPYAEQTIVHGGLQAMPLLYINEAGVTNSEATLTLAATRDWTQENVRELSVWFQGIPDNAAEPLYVAISNASGSPAVVAYEDPAAATINAWTEWRIPLPSLADQGINLGNVDQIAIGLGSKAGTTTAGGSGTMYIDDIRLYQTGP
jgi:hypothetical protein